MTAEEKRRAPKGRVAASVAALLAERDQVAHRLAGLDEEIAQVRRAMGLAPDQRGTERTCETCGKSYRPRHPSQRLCSDCRKTSAKRSVEDVKDRRGASIVEMRCRGYDGDDGRVPCEKTVRRATNRRGPLRCPDCKLAQKRLSVRRSLRRRRKESESRAKRIAKARIPARTNDDDPEPVERNQPSVDRNRPHADKKPRGRAPPTFANRVHGARQALERTARVTGHELEPWTASGAGAASQCYSKCVRCGRGARIVYRQLLDRFEFEGDVMSQPCTRHDRHATRRTETLEVVWNESKYRRGEAPPLSTAEPRIVKSSMEPDTW